MQNSSRIVIFFADTFFQRLKVFKTNFKKYYLWNSLWYSIIAKFLFNKIFRIWLVSKKQFFWNRLWFLIKILTFAIARNLDAFSGSFAIWDSISATEKGLNPLSFFIYKPFWIFSWILKIILSLKIDFEIKIQNFSWVSAPSSTNNFTILRLALSFAAKCKAELPFSSVSSNSIWNLRWH